MLQNKRTTTFKIILWKTEQVKTVACKNEEGDSKIVFSFPKIDQNRLDVT